MLILKWINKSYIKISESRLDFHLPNSDIYIADAKSESFFYYLTNFKNKGQMITFHRLPRFSFFFFSVRVCVCTSIANPLSLLSVSILLLLFLIVADWKNKYITSINLYIKS